MKSSVWRRGVVNAQQFKICAWAWNPELQWRLGCRPQFAVCPCGTMAWDSGDRLRPFKSFSGKQIARF